MLVKIILKIKGVIIVSKELLSEALGIDIRKINNSILDGNLYYYKTFVKCKSKINIYELANKCKVWAYNKGYEIVSLAHMIRIYKNGYEVYYTNSTLFDLDMFFKACQWILGKIKEAKQ